jgi:hypothetical protein
VRRYRLLRGAVSLIAAAALVGGCTGGGSNSDQGVTGRSTSDTSSEPAVRVSGSDLPADLRTSDTGRGRGLGPELVALSHVYSITPSGPLKKPATVTIPLNAPAPAGEVVFVATRETPADAWAYMPARLSADRTTVAITTTHFSLFGVLGYDLSSLVAEFKKDFIDGFDGGLTQTVDRPQCSSEGAARQDGYQISSYNGDTVYWCFGFDSSGRRVLKVTNHRRYPLELQHPHMRVLDNGVDFTQLSQISRLLSGDRAILLPGGTATFDADLSSGGLEGIQTNLDSIGQLLYALQIGVEALLKILTRFGAGSGKKAIEIVDTLLQSASCLASAGHGSGTILSNSLSPKQIGEAFGPAGLLLAPIMVAAPVVAFFQETVNGIADQWNGHSIYRIVISRPVAPTKMVTLKPVTRAGTAAPGWSIRVLSATGGSALPCSTDPSYPADGAVTGGIYYCAGGAAEADACWPAVEPQHVLCLLDPFSRTVNLEYIGKTLGPVVPVAKPVPIGLELANGDQCRLRVGGSWSAQEQHPDWVGYYSCSGQHAIFAAPSDSFAGIDDSKSSWTVHVGTFSAPLKTVAVSSAYYVGIAS